MPDTAIGHIRLDRLQAHHLKTFYRNLRENGVKERGGYAVSSKLKDFLKEKKLSRVKAAALTGVSAATIGTASLGHHISIESTGKIAAAFDKKSVELFHHPRGDSRLVGQNHPSPPQADICYTGQGQEGSPCSPQRRGGVCRRTKGAEERTSSFGRYPGQRDGDSASQ